MENIYSKFKDKPLADAIAHQSTINTVLNSKAKKVLEMGGGIGTLSYACLSNGAEVDIYEQSEECRKELKKNLAEFDGKYTITKDYRVLPPHKNYDLLIIDGGSGNGRDKGFPMSVWHYVNYITVKKIIVDGYRRMQFGFARNGLRRQYIYKITFHDKCSEIDCKKCNSKILRILNYIYWELRVKYYYRSKK